MTILQAKNIHKSYGGTPVLEGIDLRVEDREHIGLIGPNGAGKSTLLKILINKLSADEGVVSIRKGATIGYLAQETDLESDRTIWGELLESFSALREMEAGLRALEMEMGLEEVWSDSKRYERVSEQYNQLQERFERAGGYGYEARGRSALNGLGLGALDWENTSIRALSGGQKTRLALAKLLLSNPDLIILDEPTNYLDMDALTWLEQTLDNHSGALLIVSHDRWFLDRLVTIIYEIDGRQATRYPGNYSDYIRTKEARLAQWAKEYEQQQEDIRQMEEFVQKNIARASTTKRAQSRRMALEKMDRIDRPPAERDKAKIRFSPAVASGRHVLTATDLSIGYDPAAPLINAESLSLLRGQKIALLGPNGTGKTTFLKTIAKHFQPLKGEIAFGTGVHFDYYEQELVEFSGNQSVLDEVWNAHPKLTQTEVRSFLGQFLFSGEDVFKPIGALSGGEKARLSLVIRLLNQGNLLLMDEPTNHLDMDSKERLEEALEGFSGTLLFVSHDRYFINRLATGIWEIKEKGIHVFPDRYEAWLKMKREEQLQAAETSSNTSSATSYAEENRLRRQQERAERQRLEESTRLEEDIAAIEAELATIEAELCRPEIYGSPEESLTRQQRFTELQDALEKKTERWAEITD
ncbi:ATP-binding cassette, subfamily F, member 3 [Marininema mesophilum]|uniref:ATP-binding cassette, subfamily F, member 3 n=1 Tax=Marininema mesophilum TaxID=1048340 RepID=A0A1H3CJE4_9BACL|nr:ABC-F family ATP-binding cassette domain-containing protein [Marininema mesophilum]SDX54263.1 ATP-binding cassette, subfamily F, member 3 [Marininema mesophilum]